MNVPTQALPCNKTTPGEEKRPPSAAFLRAAAVREATDAAALAERQHRNSPGATSATYWYGYKQAAEELAERIANLPLPGDPDLDELLATCDIFFRSGNALYGLGLGGREYTRIKEAIRRFRK